MRLIRYGAPGHERPGVLIPGSDHLAVDISDLTGDIDGAFLEGDGLRRAAAAVEDSERPRVDLTSERLGAPFARPGAIYAIGLNYRDHATESKMDLPTEPIVFTKATNTVVGPTDPVIMPRGATKLDWEVELGVVVGKRAAYLSSLEDAADHIAGYVAVNDVSERAWQLERGGQWSKGKSFPTANPAGPYLVTPDELPAVDALGLTLQVNGELMQDGSTADIVFGPAYLVWYLSQFLVLEPGDLIDTGTPAGVGMGQDPPRYLVPGDVIELSIPGLGTHSNRVLSAEESSGRGARDHDLLTRANRA
jgi:2,4-diketo-3-deoxy-L-fuconate hydrolase